MAAVCRISQRFSNGQSILMEISTMSHISKSTKEVWHRTGINGGRIAMETTAFEKIIIDALTAVNYAGQKDNRLFLSAAQDLTSDYPDERKFLQRNVNGHYLDICCEAFQCASDQLQIVSQKASNYIQQEYRIDKNWADNMSGALTKAFFIYGNKDTQGQQPVPEKVNGFEQIIVIALTAAEYAGPEDNQRFLSAFQNLVKDYPREIKFVQRNVDDRFLEICCKAMDCDKQQRELRKQEAAQYLQNEYWIEKDLANRFAELMISGFSAYAVHRKSITKKRSKSPSPRTNQAKAAKSKHTLLIILLAVMLVIFTFGVIYLMRISPNDGFFSDYSTHWILSTEEGANETCNSIA